MDQMIGSDLAGREWRLGGHKALLFPTYPCIFLIPALSWLCASLGTKDTWPETDFVAIYYK